jgi:aconitate hydratase
VPVREVAGTRTVQVCVGSSVNSSYEDLAAVGAVLRENIVHPSVEMTVTPGSRQILDTVSRSGVYRDLVASGARMLEPVCGPCIGVGQAPSRGEPSVRTFNRNFPGRSGTVGDEVYLCSPATAAATALKGEISDPRELGDPPQIEPAPPTLPSMPATSSTRRPLRRRGASRSCAAPTSCPRRRASRCPTRWRGAS